MYTTEALLSSNITVPVLIGNQLAIYNLNNPNLLRVGEYLANYETEGFLSTESETGTLTDFALSSGTLSSSLTGLDGTLSYDETRTGWISLYTGILYLNVQVKEYYAAESVGSEIVTSVLEVLAIGASSAKSYIYEHENTLVSGSGSVSGEIDADSIGEVDIPEPVIANSNLTNVTGNASIAISSGDITLNGSPITLTARLRDGIDGSIIHTVTDSTSVADTLTVSWYRPWTEYTTNLVLLEIIVST